MNLKSFFRITITIAAAIVLFTACKRGPAIDKNDPYYPITITIYTGVAQPQPYPNNKTYRWIKENLNVTFSWDILVGDADQKMGVMIAGADYPDLLEIGDARFYEAGALIPLDELIEQYAPRLRALYDADWEKLKEDDGHIYTLPIWGVLTGKDQGTWYGGPAMFIQKDVLKEFGYPRIKTLDEYFDLIIKYKEKYPTIDGQPTIGFTILAHAWRTFNLINPPNFLAGYPNDGRGTVDPVTHEYKVFLGQDISKRWFKKLNEMNEIGLIDRSCFVDNYDQYLAKLSSGRVLGIHDQYWQFEQAEISLKTQGKADRTMVPLPLVFDEHIRPHYRTRAVPNYGQGIGISIKAKDPVRIIRFLDAQMDEEVQMIINWGFEGEDYQYDEEGVPYRTLEQWQQQEDETWRHQNKGLLWRSHNPKIEGTFSNGYPTDMNDIHTERLKFARPEDREVWAAYGVDSYNDFMDPDPPENSLWFPAWQVQNPDDDQEVKVIWQRIEAVYLKHLPRIIMAPPNQFEALWADYLKDLKDNGIEKYEAYVQKRLNKRIQKWSQIKPKGE